jgi:biotin carboxylase
MSTPRLVLIESNTSGTGRLFARAAIQQGARPILLTDDPSRYKYINEEHLKVLQINTQDEEAMFDACMEMKYEAGVAGITSSSEYFILTAAVLASRLGLPGAPPEVIRTCRDKQAQRVRLQEAAVGIPAFRSVRSAGQALKAAESLGFPVVVKPVSGTGSAGVKLCSDGNEVAQHAGSLLEQKCNERGMAIPRRILVEEFANGPEYSVETLGTQVIGITQKHTGQCPHFVEVGHDYPAPLSSAAQKIITQEIARAATALGLTWGPAHFELRLTTGGPKLIEVNPRLAGGYIPELVRLATGIDLVAETIRITRGQQPQLKPRHWRYASIRFILSPHEGQLAEWNGLDCAQDVPGVEDVQSYAKPGDCLQLRGDFRDRIGHVVATGATMAISRATVELASRLVQPILASSAISAAREF